MTDARVRSQSSQACLALAALGVLFLGCGGGTPGPAKPADTRVAVTVVADASANGGRTVRMLVQALSAQAYLEQTYEGAVALATQPDETVLADSIVVPGQTRRTLFARPEKGGVGVYFLFTEPDQDSWRLFVPEPGPPVNVTIAGFRIVEPSPEGTP